VRTILTLLDDKPDSFEQQAEKRIAQAEGVRIIRIGMPGNGCGEFDDLDRAAAAIQDEKNRPMLVHCAAGVKRTGAAYAAWRMKYCGWSLDEALAESDRAGYSIRDEPELRKHLERYYEERIRPQVSGP
jgi:protein-tyrosine phosphatase